MDTKKKKRTLIVVHNIGRSLREQFTFVTPRVFYF